MTFDMLWEKYIAPTIFFGFVALLMYAMISAFTNNFNEKERIKEAWDSKKTKSYAHQLVIDSYRDCRNGNFNPFKKEAHSTCLLKAKKFALASGYSTEWPGISKDINEAHLKIKDKK